MTISFFAAPNDCVYRAMVLGSMLGGLKAFLHSCAIDAFTWRRVAAGCPWVIANEAPFLCGAAGWWLSQEKHAGPWRVAYVCRMGKPRADVQRTTMGLALDNEQRIGWADATMGLVTIGVVTMDAWISALLTFWEHSGYPHDMRRAGGMAMAVNQSLPFIHGFLREAFSHFAPRSWVLGRFLWSCRDSVLFPNA